MIIKALNTIYMNNELIWTLVNRDVQAKYKGSWLGIFWTMGNPIIMMIIYICFRAFLKQDGVVY